LQMLQVGAIPSSQPTTFMSLGQPDE